MMEFIFVSVIITIILVTIVIFVVVALKNKHSIEENESGEIMLKNLYVYLVLFATLMMSIGGSVSAFMAIADMVSPPAYYQSFDMYKLEQLNKIPQGNVDKPKELTQEEMKTNYDQMVIEEKRRVKEQAMNSLIKSFGWIIIPLPIFLYFQRKVRKIAG